LQKQKSIGIIGAGSIAEAMLDGILDQSIFLPENIYITNRNNDDRLHFFRENYGVNTTRDYKEIVSKCRYLIIAVKPADVSELLTILSKWVTMDHIIITLAAGITTEFVEISLGKKIQVIRAMPNTSCKVKESATAIALGRNAKKEAWDFAKEIFSSIGTVSMVEESMLDAVTGLSGSGPAYVYLFMEAMIEAGIEAGLPRSLSEKLTIQTVFGAAKMVLDTGESPKRLREKVTTPGGTTMAGIKVMENADFTDTFIEAVKSATRRSQEMMTEHSSLHKFPHVL
jgi:pyrroline-5-carboxylate reductase